ncbi:MAG: leucyl aminopeptidase [Planctomycetes bacterium]|nr:leucyl aminopeptidase [Planctomycetota bacterium]
MRLTHAQPKSLVQAAPLAVVLVPKGKPGDLPCGVLGERAKKLMATSAWKGEPFDSLLVPAEAAGGPRALLVICVGDKDADTRAFRRAGILACEQGAKLGARKIVAGAVAGAEFDEARLAAFGEGAVLGAYRYPLKKAKTAPPSEVSVVSSVKGAAGVLDLARVRAEGSNLARELGDLPGNVCTPRYLRDTAEKIGRKGKLVFRAHGKKALERLKMGGILAVNQGTVEEPFLLELEYKPARYTRTVCVVGKGLTFDSGGISIKPSAGMEEMKYDMCGAAAVLGLMQAVAATRPKGVRVIGIVGTTDNMPGPGAYKPGDVVTTGSGKTIEVINTDAEGRVVLADALFQATKYDPDAIIDLATLTGAIVIALGHDAAGMFCKDDTLAARLSEASARTDERLWRMPTYDGYTKMVEGTYGDVKNSAGRPGGSCTAAAFLFHFTEGFVHAHLDIAGAAWDTSPRDGLPGGASGFGVRLLHEAITSW